MAQAEEIRFKEFRERFATEDVCRAELFRLRFAEGFVSPKCGGREFYPIKGRSTYQCRSCRHQTSVTAGTVMHRTHLPLTVWFWAIWLVATDKRGISAVQLANTLRICYDSAWHLLDRIRAAMGKRDGSHSVLWIPSACNALAISSALFLPRLRMVGIRSPLTLATSPMVFRLAIIRQCSVRVERFMHSMGRCNCSLF